MVTFIDQKPTINFNMTQHKEQDCDQSHSKRTSHLLFQQMFPLIRAPNATLNKLPTPAL